MPISSFNTFGVIGVWVARRENASTPLPFHENAMGGASCVLTRSQEGGEGVGALRLAEFIEFGSLGAPVELRRRTSVPVAGPRHSRRHPRRCGCPVRCGCGPPPTLATRMNLLEAVGVDPSLPLCSRGDTAVMRRSTVPRRMPRKYA